MTDEWNEISLKELVTVRPGKYVPKSNYVDDGSFWIYGSNSVMGRYDQALVHEPHIVMAAVGAYASAVRFSSQPSWVNNNAFALIPNERVEPFWLYLWLDIALYRDAVLAGTGQPYVKRPALLDQKLRVPPLAVQRRIVDLLAHLDNHLANLQTEREQLRRYVAALADWEWVDGLASAKRIDSLGKVVTGSTPSTKRAEYWDEPLVPFVTPGDLEDFACVQSVGRFLSREGAAASRIVSEGSILVVCIGATIGKVGIATTECATNQQINSVVGLDSSDAKYLALVLSASMAQQILVNSAGKTAVPILNKSQFQSVQVPWPDAERRSKVSAQVEAGLNLIAAIHAEVSTLKELRGSLLTGLLSGALGLPPLYDDLLSEVA